MLNYSLIYTFFFFVTQTDNLKKAKKYYCIYCDKLYSSCRKKREEWILCSSPCEKWAHTASSSYVGVGEFICEFCEISWFIFPKNCQTKLLDLYFIFRLSVHVWVGELICKFCEISWLIIPSPFVCWIAPWSLLHFFCYTNWQLEESKEVSLHLLWWTL